MEVGSYETGLKLLAVARRVLAQAKKLDGSDGEELRHMSDRLIERGLGLVIAGAKELAKELAEARAKIAAQ